MAQSAPSSGFSPSTPYPTMVPSAQKTLLVNPPSTLDELHAVIMKFHQYLRCYRDESGRIISEQFKKLPLREEDPEYYELITHPISFLMIRNRIDKLKYTSLHQWLADVELLLSNARIIASKRQSVINSQMMFKDIEIMQSILDISIKPQIFGVATIPKLEIPQQSAAYSLIQQEGASRFPLIRFVQSLEMPNGAGNMYIGDSISFLLPSEEHGSGRYIGWIVRLWKSSVISGCIVSIMLKMDQVSKDLRPPSTTIKEVFATPILKIVSLPAIIQKVTISLSGAPNIVHSTTTSAPHFQCSYLYDTGCNRIYSCNFASMSQLRGATNISERKDDAFSILPSLQNSLQSRKRVGESIKVGCSYTSMCPRTFNSLEGLCRHASNHIVQLPEFFTFGIAQERISPKPHSTPMVKEMYQNQDYPTNLPKELTACFDSDKSGRVIWFPSPPLNPLQREAPVHSAEYLTWLNETFKPIDE